MLVTALLYTYTGISLEAYIGVVISGFIIKAGVDMIRETVSDILGRRADANAARRIKELLLDEKEVLGAYDLFIHNYGPGREYASVHLELPDTMTVDQVDVLTRRVSEKIYRETAVVMTGVGVYSHNSDSKAGRIRKDISEMVLAHDWALQMHGFYLDEEEKTIRFDVVMSFDISQDEGVRIICEEVKEKYPEYELYIVPDIDITD